MALFNIWIDDTHGVDTRYMLPGNLHIQESGAGWDNAAGTAYAYYYLAGPDGSVDTTHDYRIANIGLPGSFEYAPGDGGIDGTITSMTLLHRIGAGPYTQLAHMSIALGSVTSVIGGIEIGSSLNLTPDALIREALRLDSTNAFAIHGNVGNDILEGTNSLGDLLDGRGGKDLMIGHGANDTYIVDNAGDKVIEAASEGKDTVRSYTTYALNSGASVEVLTTVNNNGTTTLNLTGNELSQTVQGNNEINILAGGLGTDKLVGLGGNDKFLFNTKLGSANVDTIADFSHGHDHVLLDNAVFTEIGKLGKLAPGAFYAGTAAHDADDRIIYNTHNGSLSYDSDGAGGHAAIRFAVVAHTPFLNYTDFIVV